MKQLTIRGFERELALRLRATARRQDISLNKAALYLMRKGAGLRTPDEGPMVVGDSLDAYIGRWTEEEENELGTSIVELDRVDEGFWR